MISTTAMLETDKAATKDRMKELLQDREVVLSLPKVGDIIDGRVIEKGRNRIYFDLQILRMGVVYKSEIDLSLYNIQTVKVEDVLPVKILELENEEGLVELSLKEAGLDKVWQDLRQLKDKGEIFNVEITDANRGGLITSVNGVQAFLPVSQLAPEHYPHVEGGDKEEIFRRLKDFIGQSFEVKILDLDQKGSKLILSERAKASKEIQEKLSGYTVGQVVEGEVTGVVDFGAFVTFDNIEGLVHISELGWQLVEHPEDIVSIGKKVSAKIIAIEDDKVSLSLKALKPNPWEAAARQYNKGDVIDGVVSKFNPFGAFIKIDSEIQGLAHVSEFESYEDMTSRLKIGQNYKFKILLLDPQNYKMALQLVDGDKDSQAQASQIQGADESLSNKNESETNKSDLETNIAKGGTESDIYDVQNEPTNNESEPQGN